MTFQENTSIMIHNPTQPHDGKEINRIIVSLGVNSIHSIHNEEASTYHYNNEDIYAVTYSKDDNSIRGWLRNINEDGPLQQQQYFKFNQLNYKDIDSFVLYKKILLFRYLDSSDNKSKYHIIDLNDHDGRFLQLDQLKHAKHAEKKTSNSIGFLPNGDLILVLLNNDSKDYKVYKYSLVNKPKTITNPWEYSQMYDIEIPESLAEEHDDGSLGCFIYQTKLFLFDENRFTQWDLLTMKFEVQYLFEGFYSPNIVINKNQTLLSSIGAKGINIFSMETGMRISKYDHLFFTPVEFVTLKDGSEGLIMSRHNDLYKFIDPFLPSDDGIEITNVIKNSENVESIIVKSNKKIYIENNKVFVTEGLSENTFQQILNKATYHSNIYTLPIFKAVRGMLEDIENDEPCDFSKIKLVDGIDGKLFRFKLEESQYRYNWIEISGFKKSQSNEWKKVQEVGVFVDAIFSCKRLNNQDLALITNEGILIYTLTNDSLKLRYFWSNEEWNNHYKESKNTVDYYKPIIQKILNNEFNDSLFSLPLNFVTIFKKFKDDHNNLYKNLILDIINDPVEFSKFGLEILGIAIDKKEDSIIQPIFDKIFETIRNNADCNYMVLLQFISLNLPNLCDHYYSNLVMKYILYTSIIIDPSSSYIKHSTNTSLYAYSKDIYIKKSSPSSPSRNNYFKDLLSSLYNKMIANQKTPVISFIAPLPQICQYKDDGSNYNRWNEMLYKPKSVLFCNIDSNDLYKWWIFAAIVNFKWKTFGRIYYYLIWFFYTIFFLCFAITSTLDNITNYYRRIFYIITIILGAVHLYFEIRQFFWKPINYVKDIWNLFDIGAYLLPIATSLCWIIHKEPPLWIVAISNLLLNFKFLLFFRIVRRSFGIYFAIIIGVARKVFPFLVVLFFFILGFAHAFYITLKPTQNFSLDSPTDPTDNNDGNNPWNIAIKYNSVNNGTISNNTTFIQTPDSNSNMFSWFPTSLLAMYLLLTGDSESLSLWTYREAPLMSSLLVLFTFFTVIYLMNLFIGLLNMAIEDYNKYEEFLLQKAQVIMEIELFYMFPYQRHKKEWFPDWIYYDIPVNEIRKLINAIDNHQTGFDFHFPPFISEKLRELVEIPDPIDKSNDELKQQTKDMEDKLRQQMRDMEKNMEKKFEQQIKELKDFFKNSNNDN